MNASITRAATLRKFNPGAMQSDEEIVRQFVVRRHQFETVIEILKENLSSESNQHLLVVAPRGRGKTMLLARVAAELRRESKLSDWLLPVRFAEESMEVLGIADFWLECLLHLANTLSDTDPGRAEALRNTHADLASILDDTQLEQRARAAVLEVADSLNRQLVLMIENLQDLTSDADKNFGWKLRKVLQTEPRIMLVASATSRFEGLLEVDQAFFELFREIALPPLDTKECQQLWQIATGRSIATKEIKPLEILTGGSPRLLIFVASFSRHHSMRQLMEELVSLIDDHTEYFRGHLEALPPKERRVYTAVLDLWQAVTAREVAQRARMDIRPTSSLLRRLVSRGAVSVKPEGKRKYYCATERLHSIYYKLRRERNEAAVVQGLVMFMAVFYTDSEFQSIATTMLEESREAPALKRGMQLAIRSDDTACERLMVHMSFEDCQDLLGEDADTGNWLQHRMFLANKAYDQLDFTLSLVYYEEVIARSGEAEKLAIKEHIASALFNRGVVLGRLERADEELESYTEVVERFGKAKEPVLKEHVAKALFNRGVVLDQLERVNEALESYTKVVEYFGKAKEPAFKELVASALFNRGAALGRLERSDEELESYTEVVERFGKAEEPALKETVASALFNHGFVLDLLDRADEAIESYTEVIERFGKIEEPALKEHIAKALFNRGIVLGRLERADEALESYAEIVRRYASESSIELQIQVAKSVALSSGLMGNHADVTDLYVDWYRRLPSINADLLWDFYNVTLHLYGAGLSAGRLVEILESDTGKADMQRPLIVALRQEMGEKVRAPAEVLEVAIDVRKEMNKIRSETVGREAVGD